MYVCLYVNVFVCVLKIFDTCQVILELYEEDEVTKMELGEESKEQ